MSFDPNSNSKVEDCFNKDVDHGSIKKDTNGGIHEISFSKLLDSAIAHAVREGTPDSDLYASDQTLKGEGALNLKKTDGFVYTIEELMNMRNSKNVINYEGKNILPERSFWREKVKVKASHPRDSSYTNKKGNKKSNVHSKKLQDNHPSDKLGTLSGTELEGMSQERISELLDEPKDELDPEWKDANLGEDLKLDMGQTVQDFEMWKMSMRNEERRKNGEVFDDDSNVIQNIKKSSNDVDSFFSFAKPKNSDQGSPSKGKNATPTLNTADISRSSRFSSFFTGHSERVPSTQQPTQAQHMMTSPEKGSQSIQEPPHGQQPPLLMQQMPPQAFRGNFPPPPAEFFQSKISMSKGQENFSAPRSNGADAFFMSLMKKKEDGTPSSNPNQVLDTVASKNNTKKDVQPQQRGPNGSDVRGVNTNGLPYNGQIPFNSSDANFQADTRMAQFMPPPLGWPDRMQANPPRMPSNGIPPNGIPPNGMPPNAMLPNGIPPNGMPPNRMPPNRMPPNVMPPNGMPPNGMPPNGMPPNGMPYPPYPQNHKKGSYGTPEMFMQHMGPAPNLPPQFYNMNEQGNPKALYGPPGLVPGGRGNSGPDAGSSIVPPMNKEGLFENSKK